MSQNPIKRPALSYYGIGQRGELPNEPFYEDPYEELRGIDRLEFNPGLSDSKGNSYYRVLFEPLEKAIKDVTGQEVSLKQGNGYSELFKPEENNNVEKGIQKFQKPVEQIMDLNPRFKQHVYGERRELMARDLAKEFYGLERYVQEHPILEGISTAQRTELNKRFNDIYKEQMPLFRNIVANYAANEGVKQSVDRSYAAQRVLPVLQRIAGQVLMKESDNLAKLDFTANADEVEAFGQKIFETGGSWVNASNEKLQELTPTGTYATALKDLSFLQGELNPKYAIATMGEQAIPNMFSTGAGIAASIIGPFGKTKFLRGLAAATAGGGAGYLLEGSASYGETKEALKEYRRKAKFDKKTMDPKEYKDKYTYNLSENYTVTADQLTDDNIEKISRRVGTVYGMMSAGVEGAGSAVGAANLMRYFKTGLGVKNTSKAMATGSIGKGIMRFKDFGETTLKAIGTEAVEETIQESLNQLSLQANVPFYQFDPSAVWKSAYSGGVFGSVLSTGFQAVGAASNYRQRRKAMQQGIEEITSKAATVEDANTKQPEDRVINAALLLGLNPDAAADQISLQLDNGASRERIKARANVLFEEKGALGKDEIVQILKTQVAKNKQKDIQVKLPFGMMDLARQVGMFDNQMVSQILGIPVKEVSEQYDFDTKVAKEITDPKPQDPEIDMTKRRTKSKNPPANISRTAAFKDNKTQLEKQELTQELSMLRQELFDLEDSVGSTSVRKDFREDRTKLINERINEIKKELGTFIQKRNLNVPKGKSKDEFAVEKQKLIDIIQSINEDKLNEISVDKGSLTVNAAKKAEKELNAQGKLNKGTQGIGYIRSIIRAINSKKGLNQKQLDVYTKKLNDIYSIYKKAGQHQESIKPAVALRAAKDYQSVQAAAINENRSMRDLTMAELKAEAKELGLRGYSKWTLKDKENAIDQIVTAKVDNLFDFGPILATNMEEAGSKRKKSKAPELDTMENELDNLRMGFDAMEKSEENRAEYERQRKEIIDSYQNVTQESFDDEASEVVADNINHNVVNIPGLKELPSFGTINNMNDMELQFLAEEEGLESTDPNEIKAEYFNKYGIKTPTQEEFNMGIPLKTVLPKPTLKIAHAWFRQAWHDSKKAYGLEDYQFDAWAEKVAKKLNPNMRSYFEEWQMDSSTTSLFGEITDKFIEGVYGTSDNFAPDETINVINAVNDASEQLKENRSKYGSDEGDISAENESMINQAVFAPFNTTMDLGVFDDIIDQIYINKISFDEFLNYISRPELGINNEKGENALVLANKDSDYMNKLVRFYASKLPENHVPINRGNKEGARKRLKVVTRKKGGARVTYIDHEKEFRTTNMYGRSILGEVTIPGLIDDIAWIDKSDLFRFGRPINKNGKKIFPLVPRGDLTGREIYDLTSQELHKKNLIPLMTRNDSGRIVLAIIKPEHNSSALEFENYWNKEMQIMGEGFADLVDEYNGKNIGDEKMSQYFGNPQKYRAGQIARHELLKKIYGTDYPSLSTQEMFIRSQVVFNTGMVRKDAKPFDVFVFDYKKNTPGAVKFVTEFQDGRRTEINAIQEIDGQMQYILDGMTITSGRKLSKNYVDQIGSRKSAKRAKTVFMGHDETGTMLWKHQEMEYNLPQGATRGLLMDGNEVIAEFKPEVDGINIYVKGKYVDNLGSRDEAKVMTGNFAKMNEIITLKSEAASHIQFVNNDKTVANFPMQVMNYITDPEFLNYVSEYYSKAQPGSNITPDALYNKLFKILSDPKAMDEFILTSVKQFPDSAPRMITDFARMGSGLHPSVSNLGHDIANNRIFKSAQNFLQRGGVLDFRPSSTETIKSNEIILPNDHAMKKNVLYELSRKAGIKLEKLNKYSLTEINELLKKHNVNVMVVRFPVPSQSGYRVMRVASLENGMGDSFKVNPQVVKEVFEGDHDHDTGHITIMDDKMMEYLKRNEVEDSGINIDQYEKPPMDNKISSLIGSIATMHGFSKGKKAIGEIASLQRNYGVLSSYLDYLVIDGQKVYLRDKDSNVTDPDMIIAATGKPETKPLSEIFRIYAQAAFDNPKLQLLNKWAYNDSNTPEPGRHKLINMMFFKENGETLNEGELLAISKYLTFHNTASYISEGATPQNKFGLHDAFMSSYQYRAFVENRNSYVSTAQAEKLNSPDDGEINPVDVPSISEIKVKENAVLHPIEARAIEIAKRLPSLEKVRAMFNTQLADHYTAAKQAHQETLVAMADPKGRTEMMAKAAGYDSVQEFQSALQKDGRESANILNEIKSGQAWGVNAKTEMLNLYKRVYKDENKSVDPNAWDYNADLNKFYRDLYYKGIGQNKAYKDLTKIEQTTATYAFINKMIDTSSGKTISYTGKLLPISKDGITLLDPDVMTEYFTVFNKNLKEIIDNGITEKGMKKTQANPVFTTINEDMRRLMNCG